MNTKKQTDAEKAEEIRMKRVILSTAGDINEIKTLTGEGQIKCIDFLEYEKGSEYLNKYYTLLKPDAPAPKNKYKMGEGLIEFFVKRGYPFNPDSEFKEGVELSGIDFRKTNITGKQLCQADIVEDCQLPKGIDFTGCDFGGMSITFVDFSGTNITGKQFCELGEVESCTLPKGIDFSGCSFHDKDLLSIDFSDANITGKQLCQASFLSICTLPKGIDFSDCSFKGVSMFRVDLSDTNITLKQIKQAENIESCTFPEGIDI